MPRFATVVGAGLGGATAAGDVRIVARQGRPPEDAHVNVQTGPDTLFLITDGWPELLPGCVTTTRETGILLGALSLHDDEWASLRRAEIMTVRIDEHLIFDGWTSQHPDGTEVQEPFEIPTSAVVVPSHVLVGGRAFREWVWTTHGTLGRLLVWDQTRDWWIVNEPDLEVQIMCARAGGFRSDDDDDPPFSWLPSLVPQGKALAAYLRERYQLR